MTGHVHLQTSHEPFVDGTNHPAMPSDTHIVVKDDVSDWEVGDRIAISVGIPIEVQAVSRQGFSAHMQSYDNAGLQMFLNNGDLNKNDGHDIPNNERGAILRRFQNDDHLVTHCSDTRCCRYDDVSGWDCGRPAMPESLLPCKELRQYLPAAQIADEDSYVCCVLAAKAGSPAATCSDLTRDDCGGDCTWNIAGDAYGWYTAEQARQCNTGCVRHTGSGYSEERVITAVSKLQDTVRLDLDRQLGQTHPGGRTVFEAPSGVFEMSTAAEVLRLTRNVRITGEESRLHRQVSTKRTRLPRRGDATVRKWADEH